MSESKTYTMPPGLTVDYVASAVDTFMRVEKSMDVQGAPTPTGYVVQGSSQKNAWKTLSGTRLAITVQLEITGQTLIATVGEGQWSDKLGAAALGWFVAWPLALTAGIGAHQQKQLPSEILAAIDRCLAKGMAVALNNAAQQQQQQQMAFQQQQQQQMMGGAAMGQPMLNGATAQQQMAFQQQQQQQMMGGAAMGQQPMQNTAAQVPANMQQAAVMPAAQPVAQPAVQPVVAQPAAEGASVCRQCGAPLAAGTKFCGSCGAKQANSCPQCGVVLPDGSKFCSKCGAQVQ